MMWGWKMTFGRTSNDPKKSIDQSSGGLSGSGKERDRGERKKIIVYHLCLVALIHPYI